MPEIETDILIVGAGFAGAATAYHLAHKGRDRILIVDREALAGVHSSGRNAAIVRERTDDPNVQPIVAEGAARLRSGRLARYERNGLILVGMGNEPIKKHFPRARGIGRWCPEDGTIDVAGLLQFYLHGQTISYNTKVFGWSNQGDMLRVDSSRGYIICRRLVNATGPWAGPLGKLPLTPMKRHLYVTGPLDWVDPYGPCVWDGHRGLYFRPESGGLLLSCCDETPAEPGDYCEDPAVLEQLAWNVSALQPGLGDLSIRSGWVGQRIFAPDRKFVIGYDPRDDRVFHVAGLGGHGVTASYAVGRMAAQLILGETVSGSETFAPSRLFIDQMNLGRPKDADCRKVGRSDLQENEEEAHRCRAQC